MDGADKSLVLLVSVAVAALTGGGLIRLADAGVPIGAVTPASRTGGRPRAPTAADRSLSPSPDALAPVDRSESRLGTSAPLVRLQTSLRRESGASLRLDAAGVAEFVHGLELKYANATRDEVAGRLERALQGLPEDFWEAHDERVADGSFHVVTVMPPWSPTALRDRRMARVQPFGLHRTQKLPDGRTVETEVTLEDLRPHCALAIEIGWLQARSAR